MPTCIRYEVRRSLWRDFRCHCHDSHLDSHLPCADGTGPTLLQRHPLERDQSSEIASRGCGMTVAYPRHAIHVNSLSQFYALPIPTVTRRHLPELIAPGCLARCARAVPPTTRVDMHIRKL